MDSMIMAARVALLIVVTGLFTALWSGDHPDRMARVDRPSKFLIVKQNVVQTGRVPQLNPSRDPVDSHDHVALFASGESRVDAPLPDGITDGTYLVTDQWGHTEIRVVTNQRSRSNDKSVPMMMDDHYSVKIGQSRWHYIRLEQPENDRTTASTTSVLSVE